MADDMETLRQEKEKAEKKLKVMADIVEKLSKKPESSGFDIKSVVEPRIKELNDKIEFRTQEIEKALASIEEKVKIPPKISGKDYSGAIKAIEPRLAKLEELGKNVESLSKLEQKMNEFMDRQAVQDQTDSKQKQQDAKEQSAGYEILLARIREIERQMLSRQEDSEKLKQFLASKDGIIQSSIQEEADKKFGYVVRGLEEVETSIRKLGREVAYNLKEMDAIKNDLKTMTLIKEDLLNFRKEKETLYETMDVKKEEISRLLEKQRKNVKVDIAVELRAMKAMIADVEQRLNQMGKPLNEEKLKSTLSKDREIIKKSIETRASKTEDRIKSLDVRLSRSEAKVSVLDKNITAASRSKKELDDRMKKREAEIKRLLGELK
jgi:hypothetical protein